MKFEISVDWNSVTPLLHNDDMHLSFPLLRCRRCVFPPFLHLRWVTWRVGDCRFSPARHNQIDRRKNDLWHFWRRRTVRFLRNTNWIFWRRLDRVPELPSRIFEHGLHPRRHTWRFRRAELIRPKLWPPVRLMVSKLTVWRSRCMAPIGAETAGELRNSSSITKSTFRKLILS